MEAVPTLLPRHGISDWTRRDESADPADSTRRKGSPWAAPKFRKIVSTGRDAESVREQVLDVLSAPRQFPRTIRGKRPAPDVFLKVAREDAVDAALQGRISNRDDGFDPHIEIARHQVG